MLLNDLKYSMTCRGAVPSDRIVCFFDRLGEFLDRLCDILARLNTFPLGYEHSQAPQ